MSTDAITVKGAGPIRDDVVITLNPDEWLHVLHGDNGTGKSTALDVLAEMTGGKAETPLTKNDVVAKGEAEGFGVRLTLSRVNRVTGECTVAALDGKYPIRAFVEPGVKDPEAADRARIKGLLAIRSVGADLDRFRVLDDGSPVMEELFGEAGPFADAGLLETTDLVEQARRFKVACEKAARAREQNAANFDGQAQACREAAEGVDLDAESDADTLQASLEQAMDRRSTLTERRNAADDGRNAVVTAEAALEDAKADYTGPSYTDARQEYEFLATAAETAGEEAVRLREQLDAAEVAADKADAARKAAAEAVDAAGHHNDLLAGWQVTIDADRPKPVSDDDMNTAVQAVATAREAGEQGTRIRDARKKADEAQRHTEGATEARDEAAQLRKAAHATDDVLADAIASPTITVEDGRLYVPHAKRVRCLVGDLSRGERARLGLLEAAGAIRTRHPEGEAAIVFPQDLFEALGIEARELVKATAEEEKIHVFTALVDFGELRTGGLLTETEPVEPEGASHVG